MSAQCLLRSQRDQLVGVLAGGSQDTFHSLLDYLLAWEALLQEDYENVRVSGRTLSGATRSLLDLVEGKGEAACRLLFAALNQVLAASQKSHLSLEDFSSPPPLETDPPSSAVQSLLRYRPSLVRKLHGHVAATLKLLVDRGCFTQYDCDEVQLPVYTPSQQARRLLDLTRMKGEDTAQLLLTTIQQLGKGPADTPSGAIYLKYQKKLRTTVSAQSRFLSTYDRTDNICLEDIYTDGVLEVSQNACGTSDQKQCPIGLEDILSSAGTVNEDADTVLISGEAGSGKSTLLQWLHLLWASGRAFQEYLFVFPFSCRRLNFMEREVSLRSLIFEHCCWPDADQDQVFQFILSHPEKTLLTFDGFDEFKFCFADEKRHCSPTSPTGIQSVLFNLLQGNLLKSVCKVITSRLEAVSAPLKKYIRKEASLKGFSQQGIESFIRKNHSDPTVTARLIGSLQSNSALFSLCHIPVFSWIVSRCHAELLGQGSSSPQTMTDLYLMILQHFLLHSAQSAAGSWIQGRVGTILRLGKLALDGLVSSCYVFSTQDLKQAQVAEEDISTGFLSTSKNISSQSGKHYEFLHITVQCFFASLFIVINDNIDHFIIAALFCSGTKKSALASVRTCPEPCFLSTSRQESRVQTLLQKAERPNLQITASFVAGLLSQRHRSALLESCQPAKLARKHDYVKKYLSKGMLKHFKSIPPPLKGEKKSMHAMPEFVWLIKCIYEMQNSDLAKDAMAKLEVEHLKLTYCNIGPAECTALAFVLRHLKKPIGLQLDCNSVGDAGIEQLLPCLEKCHAIYLRNNNISDEGICRLLEKGIHCPSFQKIALFNNNLTNECTKHFAKLLKQKQNFLSLRLGNNHITEEGAEQLAEGLRESSSLQYLGLWGNKIGDKGAEALARALQSSRTLVWLSLVDNNIGSVGAHALAELIQGSVSLEELWLRGNKLSTEEVEELTQIDRRLTF
ncbi:nucleotide-binding oligomerization domain-containing protein 2 isoform X2 [Acipenser ruthenus]|uniref:nucleotide-binding oligomerization domain-containing protein 2 isoform X2 n=1 Tax=Acipenser ruthenus TaxID=7906 RepID=UPI0027410F60|nr:nucleotide-binding oligomerization domain-containing protein 2 isoform X2 [Acipenser ruthenus]